MIVRPQIGYQEMMLATPADIAIGGGAAGSGKSWVTVVDPLRWVGTPGFDAVVFRRHSVDLKGPGSIWEESKKIYPALGGRSNGTSLEWRFPSGSIVKLNHLQNDDSIEQHRSKAYTVVHFEEVTTFTERQFWFLFGRLRSLSGIRPYMRATCNPDPDSFVAKLIAWWIDQETGLPIWERRGVLRWFVRQGDVIHWGDSRDEMLDRYGADAGPKSLTFIAGRLDENTALNKADPDYRSKLLALNTVERERLLYGNWKVRAAAGMYFKPEYFTIVDGVPADIRQQIRFWDKAATEPHEGNKDPDYTAGVKMGKLKDGRTIILDAIHGRGTPGKVDQWMTSAKSRDGNKVRIGVYRDPGQAGKVDEAHMRRLLGNGLRVTPATKSKVTNAGSFSAEAEHNGILLLRGPWNEPLISCHVAFPDGAHDDFVDAAAGAYNALEKPDLIYR